MNALSNLWAKLSGSKRYRDSFAASVVKRMIPLQVRVLRKQREWSQERLAKESQLTQGVISRAEDPDYGNLTINTLVRVAAGFDCAFFGRFVPFSELGKWYTVLEDEHELEVPSFPEDSGFIERKPVAAGRKARYSHRAKPSRFLKVRSLKPSSDVPRKPLSREIATVSSRASTGRQSMGQAHGSPRMEIANALGYSGNLIAAGSEVALQQLSAGH